MDYELLELHYSTQGRHLPLCPLPLALGNMLSRATWLSQSLGGKVKTSTPYIGVMLVLAPLRSVGLAGVPLGSAGDVTRSSLCLGESL